MLGPFATASELARSILTRELSASEVMDAHLSRIERLNPSLNAIVTQDAEGARRQARAADEALGRGESWGPLHGVPFTLKDAHLTKGMRTTVGHPSLDHVPSEDGSVAARLKAAGAILVGKTNVPPFLMSAQTNNPIFGLTRNPWNLERTAGGSSGGAASAVAAGLVPFDIGSDMSGSIRMPAHFNGVFGFKPTANRLPQTGHIPPPPGMPRPDRMMACVGPLARSVEDLGLITRILAGPDGVDLEVPPVPWQEAPARELSSLRIAYLSRFPGVPTARAVSERVERFAGELQGAGAHVEERPPGFTIEALNEVWRDYFRLLSSVFGALTGASLPIPAAEGPPATALDWVKVLSRRDTLIVALAGLLSDFDAFLSPVSISTAFPHGPPRTPIPVDGEPIESRFVDHYVYPFSFTGNPAVVVPVGLADDGLPVGIQLVGRRWGDERLLAVAQAVAELSGGFRPPPGM